jgi:two-component system response regulator CpxR
MNRVLVIDHDREFCRFLKDHLVREEMTVHFAHDGRSGLTSALSGQFDVVALEVALPGLTGLQVIKQLRANCGVGVMVLTDRGEEMDGIIGLEYGADDYLAKPVNPREFVARIRAISRRLKCLLASEFAPAPEYLEIGDLTLDEGTRTCCRNGEVIELTTVEFDLLSVLLRRSGRVIHRKELLKQVFDREYSPFDRTIDVHVSNLRRKLGALSNGTERIRGVRNIGYSYVVSAAPQSLAG